jgi:hypothetical protein
MMQFLTPVQPAKVAAGMSCQALREEEGAAEQSLLWLGYLRRMQQVKPPVRSWIM